MEVVNDITKTGGIVTSTAQRVETEVLLPVTFNDSAQSSTCRFSLKNEGVLNHSSKLVIGLKDNAAVDRAFFAPHIGVDQVISSCRLSIGGKTVCETQSWDKLQMLKSSFISQTQNLEREQYMSQKNMVNAFRYDRSHGTFADNSVTDAENYHVNPGTISNPSGGVHLQDYQLLKNTPTYSIDMRSLFPFFAAGHQLPLELIDEEILVDITFTPQTSRCFNASGETKDQAFEIDRDELRILQDIIHYPPEVMDSLRTRGKDGLVFTFQDFQLTKQSLTSAQATNINRNLGGSGRMVDKVYWFVCDENASTNTLLGPLNAVSPAADGKLTANLRINDKYVYPIDVDNPSRHFHNLTHAESAVPYLSMDEYCNFGLGAGGKGGLAGSLEGYEQTEMAGKFFYHGIKNNMNERINSQGVTLEAQYNTLTDTGDVYTLFAWISVAKVVRIQDGKVNVLYL